MVAVFHINHIKMDAIRVSDQIKSAIIRKKVWSCSVRQKQCQPAMPTIHTRTILPAEGLDDNHQGNGVTK